jgi:hypothetical protein
VSDDLEKTYAILANLWTSGFRDYYSMTSSYLTATSILVAAIALILGLGLIPAYIVAIAFSIIGLIICLQMSIALGRFRAQHAIWGRNLRLIESNENWTRQKIFKGWYEFSEWQPLGTKPQPLPAEKGEPEFTLNFAIKHHRS